MMIIQLFIKYQNKMRAIADEENRRNFKALENGVGSVHGEYELVANMATGRITYNQNK